VADWLPFRRRLQRGPSHLYLLARFADWPDPSYFLPPHNERHRNRWASQAYENLVEQAKQALDQEARIELLREADQILVYEAPLIPLFYGRQHLLVKSWVSSFPISALNGWFWKDTVIGRH
jgi:oligopeptide transport system substrate-binding protein